MAVVNVTLSAAATVHYWLQPQANIDLTTGTGVEVPNIVHGWSTQVDTQIPEITFVLDADFKWDIHLEFRGAAPIDFFGFQPGAGGDLLEMLAAQGYTP